MRKVRFLQWQCIDIPFDSGMHVSFAITFNLFHETIAVEKILVLRCAIDSAFHKSCFLDVMISRICCQHFRGKITFSQADSKNPASFCKATNSNFRSCAVD